MDKLNEFGELYISEVYDKTIKLFEMIVAGKMKGMTAQMAYAKLNSFDEEQKKIVMWFILQSVEKSVHNMLYMFEEHRNVKLFYEEQEILELSDGLAGELYSEDGWISRFSLCAGDKNMTNEY